MTVRDAGAGANLPELRQDLRLIEGAAGSGPRDRLVYDPVRHIYFMVSRTAFELLQRWRREPAEALAARARRELDRTITTADVDALSRFLLANDLTLEPAGGDPSLLAARERAMQHGLLARIVHGYFFFRVPLARPQRRLEASSALVEPLFSRTAAWGVALLSMLGVYLASRQWDELAATFLDLLSPEGVAVYAVTLVIVKALHELGHACAATRLGVRVNTMGVAFVMGMPILYTDVTDAWRLSRRRDKIAIDAAGVIVEVGLAGICLLLWSLLPEGPLRSAAFVTATSGLVMGLVVNLNPLLRLDGYHMLADACVLPNLQPRSYALAAWWLREVLFGLGRPPPEKTPRSRRALMIAYALASWLYRLVVLIGIALIVYHVLFKALGVVLLAVEAYWFILRPLTREIALWWRVRAAIAATRRSLATFVTAGVLLAMTFLPLRTSVSLQGVVVSDQETRLYAPRAARIGAVDLVEGASVTAGQVLIMLEAPDVDHELASAQRQVELVRLRLSRVAGDRRDLSNRIVLASELERHRAKIAGLEEERLRLVVRAPHAGRLRDIDPDLRRGEWIDDMSALGTIVGNRAAEVRGYVGEDDSWRIGPGASATFVAEDPTLPAMAGKVKEVVAVGLGALEIPYLASVFGGAVASDRLPDGEVRPRTGRTLVRVGLDGPVPSRTVRGTVRIEGTPESLAASMWRRIMRVLVRESGA